MSHKNDEIHIQPVGFVMIRTPLLPIDNAERLFVPNTNSDTSSTIALMIADPVIQEALAVGSPDLFHAIKYLQRDPTSRKARQAQANLLRYLIRMATRSTPFGLFAGVSTGRIGKAMDLQICQPKKFQKRARPDMQWLLYEVHQLEQRPEVRQYLRFFTNPATYVQSERLYILPTNTYGQEEKEDTISIRLTAVVKFVLDLAQNGCTLQYLEQQISSRWPSATEEQVSGIIDNLREKGVIQSDLRPPLTWKDLTPLDYVLEKIRHIPEIDDVREGLLSVLEQARRYSLKALGEGSEAFQQLCDITRASGSNARSTVQVDMRTEFAKFEFSSLVAKEAARAAEILLRLSTYGPRLRHLNAYRQEFYERYGEGRTVPILELLDEDIGLGPPLTYLMPKRQRSGSHVEVPSYPHRDRVLLALALEATRDGRLEVPLSNLMLRSLEVNESWEDTIPDSSEVYVSVSATSQDEINNGNFSLILGSRTGTLLAGRSFGRFCDLLAKDVLDDLALLAQTEEEIYPGTLFAELVYLPGNGHSANVAIRPALRSYEIAFTVAPGVHRDKVISVQDLLVGVRDNRFYIWSKSHNKEVVIRDLHLLNYNNAPNICRFLAEASCEGVTPLSAFDWGAAARLPFLPRLRVGRIILCAAQWKVPRGLIGRDIEHTNKIEKFSAAFRSWREEWNIPRFVFLTQADNKLLLDLDNPMCVQDLADEYKQDSENHPELILQEVLPDLTNHWAQGADGRYATEFVVPLQRVKPAKAPSVSMRTNFGSIPLVDRVHLPGSVWLFVKLYSGVNKHDDLLTGPIAELTEYLQANRLTESWFFIRYADPDPHIRLRIKGSSSTLISEVLPGLFDWARSLVERGFIWKVMLDTYDPEIERYGGLSGLDLAQNIFAADSVLAVNVLALKHDVMNEMSATDLGILTVNKLLVGLDLTVSERLELCSEMKTAWAGNLGASLSQLHRVFHNYYKTTQRIICDNMWLMNQLGGNQLGALLDNYGTALGPLGRELRTLVSQKTLQTSATSYLASCVHMHLNRLFGVNRQLEFEIVYYLQRTLASLEHRTSAGIIPSKLLSTESSQ